MIKKSVEKALNEQIKHEFDAAFLYLSMSAHCESMNLNGFAHWLRLQHEEEMAHGLRLVDYINDRGGNVSIKAVDKPKEDFGSPLDLFTEVLEHEKKVTKLIHKLYETAVKENDYPTQVELQWFIQEQVEEEKVADDILEQIKLVGDHGASLHRIDRILARRGAEKA